MDRRKPERSFKKRTETKPMIDELQAGLINGNRLALAKSITLVESPLESHILQAEALLQAIKTTTGKSIRIGISGVPGAGKSTFIESFGLYLCQLGHRVAVLAVDPSSSIHGGSILGDKTRMEELSRHPQAFIRPSPTEGTTGGVHQSTRESILLCEAAGYSIILIETVGVGQNEIDIRDMVDFFLLLVLTGAGDDLQGMKKGILELVDGIVVNKADGSNLNASQQTCVDFQRYLTNMYKSTPEWTPVALCCSAINREGFEQVWEMVRSFVSITTQNGYFQKRRTEQGRQRILSSLNRAVQQLIFKDPLVIEKVPELERKISKGEMTISSAASMLLHIYTNKE